MRLALPCPPFRSKRGDNSSPTVASIVTRERLFCGFAIFPGEKRAPTKSVGAQFTVAPETAIPVWGTNGRGVRRPLTAPRSDATDSDAQHKYAGKFRVFSNVALSAPGRPQRLFPNIELLRARYCCCFQATLANYLSIATRDRLTMFGPWADDTRALTQTTDVLVTSKHM